MNSMQSNTLRSIVLTIAMIAIMALLAGCDRNDEPVESADGQAQDGPGQTIDSTEDQSRDGRVDSTDDQARDGRTDADQHPQGHVREFDGFTLRANVSRTEDLPDAMARNYDIEAEADLVLLNVVVLENRPDGQSAPVSAEVSAQHESLSGHGEDIDMRAVETDGHVSYIGTLNVSDQRTLQLVIAAQPEGADEPLQMDFEVQLEQARVSDSE